jgi:3-deoxy-manno-octulosonate cytidylyltransferase (CMP-KDO synthetase)
LEAKSLDKVVVATDHVRVARVVESVGGTVCMTKASHRSGSDRVWEVASKGDWSMVVNIQGDQPGVNPMTIDACVSALGEEGVDMATAAAPLLNPNAPPSVVRVVTDPKQFAVSFGRKTNPSLGLHRRHLGIYAFRRSVLQRFAGRQSSEGEIRENLEQLRVLEYGGRVKVVCVESAAPSVDQPSDLEALCAWKMREE